MACQKVCKQDRDDIIVKVNLQALSLYLFTLQWKRCRDEALYIYLHYYIFRTLFAYFFGCHPYIFLHF